MMLLVWRKNKIDQKEVEKSKYNILKIAAKLSYGFIISIDVKNRIWHTIKKEFNIRGSEGAAVSKVMLNRSIFDFCPNF